MGTNLKLEEFEIYKVSMEIGEMVWELVASWHTFEKETLGRQFVRAADSIALNISEGYGRFYYKENKNFCYYSRGSAKETATILAKAKQRKLITPEQYLSVSDKFNSYFKLSFYYIKSIGTQKDST